MELCHVLELLVTAATLRCLINGGFKINEAGGGGEGVGISRKRRGKLFKVEHKGSSKLGITVLGQAGQVQCDNGPKNIPYKHYRLLLFLPFCGRMLG